MQSHVNLTDCISHPEVFVPIDRDAVFEILIVVRDQFAALSKVIELSRAEDEISSRILRRYRSASHPRRAKESRPLLPKLPCYLAPLDGALPDQDALLG